MRSCLPNLLYEGNSNPFGKQGGQIMDNAVCGGPDSGSGITSSTPGINANALNQVKAVIMMGNPRYRAGLSYNVGTCTAYGVCPSSPFSELTSSNLPC